MGCLSRESISASPLRTRREDVPEWGGYVWLHELSGTELEAWESLARANGAAIAAGSAVRFARAGLLAHCIRDDDGKRLYDDSQIEELSGRAGYVLDRLFESARKLNKLGAEEVEAVAKNSEATPAPASI